jgi:SSS family solute:Na+ symporter
LTARVLHPALANPELALPTLLARDLPPAVGALGLAALFSAELSAADAVLFMLSTSLAQDLYHRFVRPKADERQVLLVVRLAAAAAGAAGIAIAIFAPSVVDALKLFYGMMGAGLFVPVVGALLRPRAGSAAGLSAVIAGASAMVIAQFALPAGQLPSWCPPSLVGIVASALAFALMGEQAEQPV